MRIVGVVQARVGSTRLPGKVLAPIAGRPLILWTLAAMAAVAVLDTIVIATTTDPADDQLATVLRDAGWTVHRGPVYDVLTRCWEAVASLEPDLVVRETADNPFMDPAAVAGQIRAAIDGRYDYVGPAGWPLGIAGEVARADALETAYREATGSAEREHVMPFLYARPERFRIGSAPPAEPVPPGRYTVDTAEDLAFARAVAQRLGERLGPDPTVHLEDLRRIVMAEPALLDINAAVPQKPWQEAER